MNDVIELSAEAFSVSRFLFRLTQLSRKRGTQMVKADIRLQRVMSGVVRSITSDT